MVQVIGLLTSRKRKSKKIHFLYEADSLVCSTYDLFRLVIACEVEPGRRPGRYPGTLRRSDVEPKSRRTSFGRWPKCRSDHPVDVFPAIRPSPWSAIDWRI